MKPAVFKMLINIWPPYWGTGIRVVHISRDYREVLVEMKLRFYNRNYVRTHFGGSLYAMIDPFYMLMLMNILGRGYIVWDQSASIEFVNPGKSDVRAHFHMDEEIIADIIEKTSGGEKYIPEFFVNILDKKGRTVARASKKLYIRKKQM